VIILKVNPQQVKSQRSDISILKEICDVHKIKGEYRVKIRKLPDPQKQQESQQ